MYGARDLAASQKITKAGAMTVRRGFRGTERGLTGWYTVRPVTDVRRSPRTPATRRPSYPFLSAKFIGEVTDREIVFTSGCASRPASRRLKTVQKGRVPRRARHAHESRQANRAKDARKNRPMISVRPKGFRDIASDLVPACFHFRLLSHESCEVHIWH